MARAVHLQDPIDVSIDDYGFISLAQTDRDGETVVVLVHESNLDVLEEAIEKAVEEWTAKIK